MENPARLTPAIALLAAAGCSSCDGPDPRGRLVGPLPSAAPAAFAEEPGTVRCLELPGATREGLFVDRGRVVLVERSDPREPPRLHRVAIEPTSGESVKLGDAVGLPPRPAGGGRALALRPDGADAGAGAALFVEGPDGAGGRRVSGRGQAVTSFAADEPRGLAYYAAAGRLWRAPLQGGEAAEVAENVADVWAIVDGGVAALVRGQAGSRPETQLVPLGGGVRSRIAPDLERLGVFGDRVLVTGEAAGEPPRQLRLSGGATAPIDGLWQGDTLLAGGAPDVFFARTEGRGSTLLRFDGDRALAVARIRGGWFREAATLASGSIAALVAQDTDDSGSSSADDETDLCVVGGGAGEPAAVAPRSVPARLAAAWPRVEGELAGLGAHQPPRAVDRGTVVSVVIDGDGPPEAEELGRLARRLRGRLAVALSDERIGAHVSYAATSRFAVAAWSAAVSRPVTRVGVAGVSEVVVSGGATRDPEQDAGVAAEESRAHADARSFFELLGEAYRIGRLVPPHSLVAPPSRAAASSIPALAGPADRHADVLELEVPDELAGLGAGGRQDVIARLWRAVTAHQRVHHGGEPAQVILHERDGIRSAVREGKLVPLP